MDNIIYQKYVTIISESNPISNWDYKKLQSISRTETRINLSDYNITKEELIEMLKKHYPERLIK